MDSYVTRRRVECTSKHTPSELITLDFPVNLPNQNYAIISYVAEHTKPSASWWGMRIYCTCATTDEAERIVEKARSNGYTEFDLFIVDIAHGFFPMPPPDDADIANLKYSDDILNEIMVGDQGSRVASSKQVMSRAEAELAKTTVEDEFKRQVHIEALELFEEWKQGGSPAVTVVEDVGHGRPTTAPVRVMVKARS